MKKIKKILKKLWANRPFRTFIQGFLGVLAGTEIFSVDDMTIVVKLIISAIMAGISAVMSLSTGEETEIDENAVG